MKGLLVGSILCVLPILVGCEPSKEGGPTDSSGPAYLERRQSFQTKLVRAGPSPQSWRREAPPRGVKEILYSSGDLKLKAWVFVPDRSPGVTIPALVYFHGGFAFGSGDLADCEPFMDAGFVVMCPTLRGENGNPGNFELLFGEINDARAAIRWLVSQPYVDKERIYAFGHSVGGGVSALLSLFADVPVRHGGSSGGLYDRAVFDEWSDFVPFDLRNPEEREMRVLLQNTRYMHHRHYAYVGADDNFNQISRMARREAGGESSKLEVIQVQGDHFSSLRRAIRAYLRIIQQSDP